MSRVVSGRVVIDYGLPPPSGGKHSFRSSLGETTARPFTAPEMPNDQSMRASPRAMSRTWRADRVLEGTLTPRTPLKVSMGMEGDDAARFDLAARMSEAHAERMAAKGEAQLNAKELRSTQAAHHHTLNQLNALRHAHQKLADFTADLQQKLRDSDDAVRGLSRQLRTESEVSSSSKAELQEARREASQARELCEITQLRLKDRELTNEGLTRRVDDRPEPNAPLALRSSYPLAELTPSRPV